MIPLVKVLATPFHGKPRASGDDPYTVISGHASAV